MDGGQVEDRLAGSAQQSVEAKLRGDGAQRLAFEARGHAHVGIDGTGQVLAGHRDGGILHADPQTPGKERRVAGLDRCRDRRSRNMQCARAIEDPGCGKIHVERPGSALQLRARGELHGGLATGSHVRRALEVTHGGKDGTIRFGNLDGDAVDRDPHIEPGREDPATASGRGHRGGLRRARFRGADQLAQRDDTHPFAARLHRARHVDVEPRQSRAKHMPQSLLHARIHLHAVARGRIIDREPAHVHAAEPPDIERRDRDRAVDRARHGAEDGAAEQAPADEGGRQRHQPEDQDKDAAHDRQDARAATTGCGRNRRCCEVVHAVSLRGLPRRPRANAPRPAPRAPNSAACARAPASPGASPPDAR